MLSLQGVDVGEHIIDGLFILHDFRHESHLLTIQVLRVCTADPLLVIPDLGCHVPVIGTGNAWRFESPYSLPVSTVTCRAVGVNLCAFFNISGNGTGRVDLRRGCR